jgi:hypothetical protein
VAAAVRLFKAFSSHTRTERALTGYRPLRLMRIDEVEAGIGYGSSDASHGLFVLEEKFDLGACIAMICLATPSSPEATPTNCIVISNVRARDIVFRMCGSI